VSSSLLPDIYYRFVKNYHKYFLLLILMLLTLILIYGFNSNSGLYVQSEGMIIPNKEYVIHSNITGIIDSIYCENGKSISKNSPLVILNKSEFENKSEELTNQKNIISNKLLINKIESENLLEKKKNELAKLEIELKKMNLKHNSDSISLVLDGYNLKNSDNVNLEVKKLSISQKKIEINQLKLEITDVRVNDLASQNLLKEKKNLIQKISILNKKMFDCTIKSPVKGYCIHSSKLVPGKLINFGEEIAKIVDTEGGWTIVSNIKETDYPELEINQKVYIYINAYPYQEFDYIHGKINHINEFKNSDGFYEIQVSINKEYNDEIILYRNMSVKCKIIKKDKNLLQYYWKMLF